MDAWTAAARNTRRDLGPLRLEAQYEQPACLKKKKKKPNNQPYIAVVKSPVNGRGIRSNQPARPRRETLARRQEEVHVQVRHIVAGDACAAEAAGAYSGKSYY